MEPNNDLKDALDQVDIELWLEQEGVQYRRTRGKHGVQLNLKECPVCGSEGYKTYINADSGLGNCFHGSCEAKFNKWSLIKAYMQDCDNRAIVEHIKKTAQEHGWMPKRAPAPFYTASGEGIVQLPMSVPLTSKTGVISYLKNRGITPHIAELFELRVSYLSRYVFDGVDGREGSQDYSRRVIIPVRDLDGKLVTFQGRDMTGKAEKKYLFPPGLESTGSIIYNGHNVTGLKSIIVGEGVFDCIAIKMAIDEFKDMRGVGAVASFGKHLSSGDERSQVSKLLALKEQGLQMITFMWDGEPQALHDAIDAALVCHGLGFTARVAILPADKDPNEVSADVIHYAYWHAVAINKLSAVKLKLSLPRRASPM